MSWTNAQYLVCGMVDGAALTLFIVGWYLKRAAKRRTLAVAAEIKALAK